MKEENLTIGAKKRKKYSSYQREISLPVENIIDRDFHAQEPNEKRLTDITEFAISAGKVYLSPIVDCFDGYLWRWTIGISMDRVLKSLFDHPRKMSAPSYRNVFLFSGNGEN